MKRICLFIITFFLITVTVQTEAHRGCCSWHGGVVGCDSNTGHQLCADGTDSPSCMCGY